jgi:hypothetical protein
MNLQELLNQLKTAQQKLEDANIDDSSKIRLDILIKKIKKKIIMTGFEPLTEISAVEVPDISKLPGLMDQVDVAIENEEKRKALFGTIMSIAKKGLNVIGLPI